MRWCSAGSAPVQVDPSLAASAKACADQRDRRRWCARAFVNDRPFAAASSAAHPKPPRLPNSESGDVVRLIETRPRKSAQSLRSDSGMLSGAFKEIRASRL